MIRKRQIAAFASVILASVSVTPAFGAELLSSNSAELVPGLIIELAPRASALSDVGEPVGQQLTNVELQTPLHLGGNFYSVGFEQAQSPDSAAEVVAAVARDPRISKIKIDQAISPQALNRIPKLPSVTAIRAAAAPRSLSVRDAFTAADQYLPRVALSWGTPTSLNGAKLVGYRIEKSIDGKTWNVAVSDTRSTMRSAIISNGLEAGQNVFWRVKAITKSGSSSKIGLASVAKAVKPTTSPAPPVLTSGSNLSNDGVVTWKSQTLAERGGLVVTYVATATGSDGSTLSCSTTKSNTCQISPLVAGVSYTVSLTATNQRGSAKNESLFAVSDPLFKQQWHLSAANGINVEAAWKVTAGSPNVVVSVIDSGLVKHPDLTNVVDGYDFVRCLSASNCSNTDDGDGEDADPTDSESATTAVWHGTHVAGLIAAQANGIGTVGVAPNVRIQPIRVLSSEGGSESWLIRALNWAAGIPVAGVPVNKTPAKVINLSLASPLRAACDPFLDAVFEPIKDLGITVITAVGNENEPAQFYSPGNCYPTISVGATGPGNDRASYSNYGSDFTNYVDIAAPGGDSRNPAGAPNQTRGAILSTISPAANNSSTAVFGVGYGLLEGTSMAAPIFAGVVALLYSVNPELTADQIWQLVRTTAKPYASGTQGAAGLNGIGIVDAGAAVAAALKIAN